MSTWSRRLVSIAAAAVMLAAVADVNAETCTLELKRLGTPSGYRASGRPSDYMFRYTTSQSFFTQTGQRVISRRGNGGGEAEFSKLVKKEPPKYESKHPFRGVAKLGTQQFCFVLDAAPAKKKTEAKKVTGKKKDGSQVAGKKKESKTTKVKPSTSYRYRPERYSRLFFDLNHNGDLTDDGVIESKQPPGSYRIRYSPGYSHASFPRVDLTVEADGTKMEYAFFFSVYSRASTDYQYASASLSAAAYREGEITLDGKRKRIVLVDFNSNGRFDDGFTLNNKVKMADGTAYPKFGDMMYVDPDTGGDSHRSYYNPTANDQQHYLAKLMGIENRFYDVKITPAGDKLTLTPSLVPVGHVTNANKGYRALVYGDGGVMKIAGDESGRAPLPEGNWKLLSYMIDRTEADDKPAEKKKTTSETPRTTSFGSTSLSSRPRYTRISARAKRDCAAVKVRGGKTVPLPFGPPYKPIVKVSSRRDANTVYLGMSLVGAGGEVCSSIVVGGQRPAQPEFTITTPDGKEVASGKFKFG